MLYHIDYTCMAFLLCGFLYGISDCFCVQMLSDIDCIVWLFSCVGSFMDNKAGTHCKCLDTDSIGYGFLVKSSDLQHRQKSFTCSYKINYICNLEHI